MRVSFTAIFYIEGGACGGVERVEAAALLDDVALVASLQARLRYATVSYENIPE